VLSAVFSRAVIFIPYLWLFAFFLAPFAIVFKISLSETTIAMPPYLPVFSWSDGIFGMLATLRELSFENYLWLIDDSLYFNAYISSVVIAGISTFIAPAHAAAHAGDPAVLDQLPHSRLCVDRHPQA
jgi:putrescine transport system permease protein